MTFNEANSVRDLVRDQAISRGWTFIPGNELDRDHNEVLIETDLREALIRLNPTIAAQPSRADEVIHRLRGILLSGRRGAMVPANEEWAAWLNGARTMPFGPNGQHVTINLLDTNNPELDTRTVSTEVTFTRGQVARRADLVFYINGMPLIIGEAKSPVRPAYTWVDAASQLHDDYEKNIPEFFVPSVFLFATEGKEFHYATIRTPIHHWGPWRNDQAGPNLIGIQTITAATNTLLTPAAIQDFARFYTAFATDSKHRKIKLIARYQQYLAGNAIVNRVRDGQVKKGLIWHFQGSGKSLLMVFTATKLRAQPDLAAPTILIVVDRLDLDTQISDTFKTTDIPNVISTDSREELHKLLQDGTRKIIITTIHKFAEAEGVLNDRDNIVVMVDEAHRTQEGDLGRKMREALPNAFLFGLTGTPINRRDRNTFYAFGSDTDTGGYMSLYSFSDSIRDGATLPLHFEPRLVELRINREQLDEGFTELTEDLSDKQKALLSAKAANTAHLLKASDRIAKVAADIYTHFTTSISPLGLKGQIVVYDKQACVLMKHELDKLLDPDASTIVMSMDARDPQEWRDNWGRDRDEEKKTLDRFRDPQDPLQILIVTAKLLTGFDAPILAAQYLDKPLRDHTLLQAICRTNRTYPGKTHGLVVDYLGIFDDAAQAMLFDDKTITKVITDISALTSDLPAAMEKALGFFDGVDRTLDGWEGLQAAQQKLPDDETRDDFGRTYSHLSQLWEAISPDPMLSDYETDYRWLTEVYESVRPADHTGKLVWHNLGPKTLELINSNITVEVPRDDLEIIVLDAHTLEELASGKKDPETTMKAISGRIAKHQDNPVFQELGERLTKLKERYEHGQQASLEFLRELVALARDTVAAEKAVDEIPREEKGKAALTELFEAVKTDTTPIIVERVVSDIDEVVRAVRFDGWQDTNAGDREVQKALRKTLYVRYKLRDEELFQKAHEYVRQYY
ncbi:MAG: type I restriction endonuclease subunit R [Candidatus Nanopelagicales bacterium]|nr:type I restriction endonuclease subunit R [Candidatus Nanopelagicales bacterium]